MTKFAGVDPSDWLGDSVTVVSSIRHTMEAPALPFALTGVSMECDDAGLTVAVHGYEEEVR